MPRKVERVLQSEDRLLHLDQADEDSPHALEVDPFVAVEHEHLYVLRRYDEEETKPWHFSGCAVRRNEM